MRPPIDVSNSESIDESAMNAPPNPILLSIIVPCFNQGQYLGQAIESVLGQGGDDFELVVVDDGSTDDTREVAESFVDRITLISQENAGLPAARNRGLAAGRGEWVLFLDSDDYLAPDFIEQFRQASSDSPDADLLIGRHQVLNETGALSPPLPQPHIPDDAFHHLLRGNRMPCHTVVVRKSVVDEMGGFDPALTALEDWDLWLRIAAGGHRFRPMPEAIAIYRRYEGSMSRDVQRMTENARRVLARFSETHPRCGQCRRSFRRGLWNTRMGVIGSILVPRTRALMRQGQMRRAFGALFKPILEDGWLLPVLCCYPLAVIRDTVAGRFGNRSATGQQHTPGPGRDS